LAFDPGYRQVPEEQVPIVQNRPSQQALPISPQGSQRELWQARPGEQRRSASQQGWPAPPQATQLAPLLAAKAAVQRRNVQSD
jgi:hypothetical protein